MFGINIAVNDVVDIVGAVGSGYSSWRRCARRVVLSPQSIKSPVVVSVGTCEGRIVVVFELWREENIFTTEYAKPNRD